MATPGRAGRPAWSRDTRSTPDPARPPWTSPETTTPARSAARRGPPGRYGDALRFDGDAAVVRVPASSSLNLTRAMTLSGWIRPTAPQDGWRTIVQRQTDAYLLAASSDRQNRSGGIDDLRAGAARGRGGVVLRRDRDRPKPVDRRSTPLVVAAGGAVHARLARRRRARAHRRVDRARPRGALAGRNRAGPRRAGELPAGRRGLRRPDDRLARRTSPASKPPWRATTVRSPVRWRSARCSRSPASASSPRSAVRRCRAAARAAPSVAAPSGPARATSSTRTGSRSRPSPASARGSRGPATGRSCRG